MRLGEPSWWYDGHASAWPFLLSPVAAIAGAMAAHRMSRPPRYSARLPVVCVGNFTAGGTGKTPTVATIVRLLSAQGHTPVVLSRGYGGSVRTPRWVRDDDDAALVGDEPRELAAHAAVVVAPDRVAGARMIEVQPIASARGEGRRATAIVMDDGLQNSSLRKDLAISVVDAARGVGNGFCVPAGPLRAPLAGQLRHVHAIVLNCGSSGASAIPAQFADFPGPVLRAQIEPSGDVSWLAGRPVVAFAAIGVPVRFQQTLLSLGADVREMIAFPDHQRMTEAEARHLLAAADAHGATLVTTRKDAVRLSPDATGLLADLRQRLRTVDISLAFSPADSALLSGLLAQHAPLRH